MGWIVDTTVMDTEKATSHLDMPHAAQSADYGICFCGRYVGDELHGGDPVTQTAGHTPPMQTEKGS